MLDIPVQEINRQECQRWYDTVLGNPALFTAGNIMIYMCIYIYTTHIISFF